MEIKCEERYRQALAHAEKTADTTLTECLERLKLWEANMGGEVTLSKDFAPLSFYFEIMAEDGSRIMNGGVLYHGNPDESRAVQLVPSTGWQIHT